MSRDKNRVCPVELAGGLDNWWRRVLQNPRKLLALYVRDGMTALDLGCGPGYFTLPMAEMVGETGRVIACDLQEGMLQLVAGKLAGSPLASRVTMQRCSKDTLGVREAVDFVLIFYVMHELPDQKGTLSELSQILRDGGEVLIVEPPLHVSASEFAAVLDGAREIGFAVHPGPRMLFHKTALLRWRSR